MRVTSVEGGLLKGYAESTISRYPAGVVARTISRLRSVRPWPIGKPRGLIHREGDVIESASGLIIALMSGTFANPPAGELRREPPFTEGGILIEVYRMSG